MKKIEIFEPSMCCPTGLCGVSVDPELLRLSTVLNTLAKKGMKIERYNLTSTPMKFISNPIVNKMINSGGVDDLPYTLIDNEIVITGRYPTNAELAQYVDLPADALDHVK